MKKTRFWSRWKKFVMCLAVVTAVFAVSKAATVYAGDFTTAGKLPTNGVWSGKCVLEKDATDYYKFTISKAGLMDIKLMSYASSIGCTLYDSEYDRIDGISSYGSETSPETRTMTKGLSQGTYYISVSQSYGAGGNYRLYASFSSSGLKAADGDSFDSPQSMRVNSKVFGALTHSNGVDWYKVTIPSSGNYRYIFQNPGKINCYLYDKNLSQCGNSFGGYSEKVENREIWLNSGIYYIKVESGYYGKYACQIKEDIPAKGAILTDSKNRAQYKVTKAGKRGGTVAYQGSVNGMKTSVAIPSTVKIDNITYKVTGVASNAFKGNSMLKKVTLGKNVASIGANAFSQCSGLKSITIPTKVSAIGKRAFYGCRNLKKITIKSTKLTSSKIGANAFKGIHKKALINVPKSKLRSYKSVLKKKGVGKGAVFKKLP